MAKISDFGLSRPMDEQSKMLTKTYGESLGCGEALWASETFSSVGPQYATCKREDSGMHGLRSVVWGGEGACRQHCRLVMPQGGTGWYGASAADWPLLLLLCCS